MHKEESFVFRPNIHYVIDYNTALNFPEYFDPTADLPERHLIISDLYQRAAHRMSGEKTDRGVAASELIAHLKNITTYGHESTLGKTAVKVYTINNLSVAFDYDEHKYSGARIEGEHLMNSIALSEHWGGLLGNDNVVLLTNSSEMKPSTIYKPNLNVITASPAPYTGYYRTESENAIAFWQRYKKMPLDVWQEESPNTDPLKPHEFILFGHARGNSFGHIGRYDAATETIVPLTYYQNISGIKPIGERQAMAFEAMMAPASIISTVILYGNAGSGKTFSTVSAALAQTSIMDSTRVIDSDHESDNNANRKGARRKRNKADKADNANCAKEKDTPLLFIPEPKELKTYPYQGVSVCLPDGMLGRDLGAVPGDKRAKLNDKADAYRDNIRNFLRTLNDKARGGRQASESNIAYRAEAIFNRFELCTPGQINGRDFWNRFIICDEAQFNSLAQLKAFIERCDIGTKIVFCGDPSQVDNPFGWYGNPLMRAVRYLSKDPSVAIICFDGGNIIRPGAQIIARSWPR